MDGNLAYQGVSSHHFDAEQRGFTVRADAPLDMRMNRSATVTAADVVNGYSAEQLMNVLQSYGEVEGAYRVAELIVKARNFSPILSTHDLIRAVQPRIPRKDESKFLSKLFQALRIEVNGEMEALKMALEQSLKILRPGGRLVVISYHSLEDRLVKNFMRNGCFEAEAEKDFYGQRHSPFAIVTRKAIQPTEQEINANPRSRSAKLRAAQKIEQ